MIIYNVLQHFNEKLCSHESWSPLLTSPLSASTIHQKKIVLKDKNFTRCLLVSPQVPTLKTQKLIKQQPISRKRLLVCLFPDAAERDSFRS